MVILFKIVQRTHRNASRVDKTPQSPGSGGKIRFDLGEIATEFFFTPKCSEKSA
jgi:hypothetical protein